MSQKRTNYSEGEILSYLREYYLSGLPKSVFCKLHGLCGHSLLNKWLKKYGASKELVSLAPELNQPDMANRSKEEYREEIAQLKRQLKDLEKALAFSKLETEARDLMITRAEEYFAIPIRKKSGAK